MTDTELQSLRIENAARRARKEAATPGPWYNNGNRIDDANGLVFLADYFRDCRFTTSSAFIAAARSDPVEDRIDQLLAEIERLKTLVSDMKRSLCEHCAGRCPRGKN